MLLYTQNTENIGEQNDLQTKNTTIMYTLLLL